MDENDLPRLLFEAGIATQEQAEKLAALMAERTRNDWMHPDGTMTG